MSRCAPGHNDIAPETKESNGTLFIPNETVLPVAMAVYCTVLHLFHWLRAGDGKLGA